MRAVPLDSDAVLHPRGPELPAVYWRRRAALLGVFLVVLFLVARSCGDDKEPDTVGQQSPTPTASATTSSPRPTSGTSGSAPTSSGDTRLCADTDLTVQGTSKERTYAAGTTPRLSIVIVNSSSTACRRAVGQAVRELLVYSGNDRIWSSDDCRTSNGSEDVKELKAGERIVFEATWGRTRSEADASATECAKTPSKVDPGTYRVVVKLGDLEVKGDTFSLR